jgi:hypothetical protein
MVAVLLLPHEKGTYLLVQSCVSYPFSCPHCELFSISARIEFKTNILRAMHQGSLVPDDVYGLNVKFDLKRVSKECKATNILIENTFQDVGLAYMHWYRNPTVPMEIEPEVFAEAIGAGGDDVEKKPNGKAVQSTSASEIIPDLVHSPDSEGTKMMKQIVFFLETLSDQSQDGLDKMESLVHKVSELVEKFKELTNEAENIVGNPLEEIDDSDEYTEETLEEMVSKEEKSWWSYLFILVAVVLVFMKQLFVDFLSYLIKN